MKVYSGAIKCLVALSILFIVLSFVSCGFSKVEVHKAKPLDEPIMLNAVDNGALLQYSDGKIYYIDHFPCSIRIHPENRSVRYILANNGTVEFVCNKPLCRHNSTDCPLFAIHTMCVFQDKMIYTSIHAEMGSTQMHVSRNYLDLDTNKSVITDTIDDDQYAEYTQILFHDKFAFYFTDDIDEKSNEWNLNLNRLDMNTGKTIVLYQFPVDSSTMSNDVPCKLLFGLGDHIYYSENGKICSADLSCKKIVKHIDLMGHLDVLTDGYAVFVGMPYHEEDFRENYNIEVLYKTDFNFQEFTELGIIAEKGRVKITDNFIYYVKYDEISIGKSRVSGYNSDEVILTGSEIWRCDHNGEHHEMVFKFEGPLANTRPLHEIVVGDNIYTLYTSWIDHDGDGIFTDGDHYMSYGEDVYDILKIYIPTGEITHINGLGDHEE